MTTYPIRFDVAEFSDAYKATHDMRPSARECEWFLALSDEDKAKEIASLEESGMSHEDKDQALAHGEIWSACNLLTEKIASHPELLSDELFEAVMLAKGRREAAEQAQYDAWAS